MRAWIVLLFVASLWTSARAQFVIHNLGSLGGNVVNVSINNAGLIAGDSYLTGNSSYQGFTYSSGTMTMIPTSGGTLNTVNALNDLGQIVGGSGNIGVSYHGYVLSNGIKTDLGSLGAGSSSAVAINNSGQIAGYYYTNTNGTGSRAFLNSAGTSFDLGTLGGANAAAYDINNIGIVVGSADIAVGSQQTHAFYYSAGSMYDIGTLGGSSSTAWAINDVGQIVGSAETPLNAGNHAFLYSGGVMSDLGSFGGWFSSAMDINGSGAIVGTSELTTGGIRHAFLYSSGSLLDLNSATDLSGTNFSYLLYASGINDAGDIVGVGVTSSGGRQAFLLSPTSLTPVPEPGWYALIFSTGLIGLAGWRWRTRLVRNPTRG